MDSTQTTTGASLPSTSSAATTPAATTATTTTTAPVAPQPFDPFGATIIELQEALAEGRLTSVGLVDFYMERIEAYDRAGPMLNAFITINPQARSVAQRLDEERTTTGPRGPLHGIPIVLKDNIGTADLPTTAGSAALTDFVPAGDAYQVSRLRAAGAIVLGKVNLQEWARSIHSNSSISGRTLSPYVPTRNVGGSSGGTAAAVTAQLAAAGLGSDTCGSIRVPAAFNSLFGLRPTIGLSSRTGVIPLAPSEDTVGPMARTVTDLALLLDATAGPDPADPTTAAAGQHIPDSYLESVVPNGLAGARIGVIDSLFGTPGEVAAAVRDALGRMEQAGAVLVDVEVPDRASLTGGATATLLREFPSAVEAYLDGQPTAPISSLDEVVESGLHLPESTAALEAAVAVVTLDTAEYREALAARPLLVAAVTATLDEHHLDALAYPSIQNAAAENGIRQTGNNCATATVAGLPALAVPAGLDPGGMPVGIDLLGRAFDEPTLIRLAAGYEAAVNPRVEPPLTPPLGG